MAGTIKADKWENGDGTENYKCRAWVNFDGTGTVAIRAAGNVSSITDNGIGDYTVNFTTAMVNGGYAAICEGQRGATADDAYTIISRSAPYSTTAARVRMFDRGGTAQDASIYNVAIFR